MSLVKLGGKGVSKVVEDVAEAPLEYVATKPKINASKAGEFFKQHGSKLGIGALAAGAGLAGYMALRKNRQEQR